MILKVLYLQTFKKIIKNHPLGPMLYQLDMYMRAILNQRQHCVVKINNQNKLMNYKIHLLYIYDKGPPTCVQMMGAECVKFVTHTCLIQKCPI